MKLLKYMHISFNFANRLKGAVVPQNGMDLLQMLNDWIGLLFIILHLKKMCFCNGDCEDMFIG